MTSWFSEYIAALEARDVREKAQIDYINAYAKLADRTAALELRSAVVLPEVSSPPQSPAVGSSSPQRRRRLSKKPENEASISNDMLARLRSDLASTQKIRTELEEKQKALTKELEQLRVKAQRDTKRIEDLERERAALERRVKDRDEELKGKTRLIEEVQNEMVSLDLQLHMVEKRSEGLERENKDLVDRWMTRMGEEAEAMNNASKWS